MVSGFILGGQAQARDRRLEREMRQDIANQQIAIQREQIQATRESNQAKLLQAAQTQAAQAVDNLSKSLAERAQFLSAEDFEAARNQALPFVQAMSRAGGIDLVSRFNAGLSGAATAPQRAQAATEAAVGQATALAPVQAQAAQQRQEALLPGAVQQATEIAEATRPSPAQIQEEATARAQGAASVPPRANAALIDLGLQLRTQGIEVDANVIGQNAATQLNSLQPDQAAQALAAGRSGQVIDFDPDTGRLRIGPASAFRQEGPETFDPRLAAIIGQPGMMTTEQAAQRGLKAPSSSETEKLLAQASSRQDLISNVRTIQALVSGRNDLLGLPAAISRFTDAIRAQSVGLAQLAGAEIEASTDPNDYADVFEELNIESNRLRGLMLSTAYALAASRETGKLTDRDVENSLRTLGKSLNPQSFVQTLQDVVDRTERRHRTDFNIRVGAFPEQTLTERIELQFLGKPAEEFTAQEVLQLQNRANELELRAFLRPETAQTLIAIRDGG